MSRPGVVEKSGVRIPRRRRRRRRRPGKISGGAGIRLVAGVSRRSHGLRLQRQKEAARVPLLLLLLLPPISVVVGCAVEIVVAVARVSHPNGVAPALAPRCGRGRRCPGDSSSLSDGSAAAVVRSEATEGVGVEHAAAGVAATETTTARVGKAVRDGQGCGDSFQQPCFASWTVSKF